MSAKNTFLSAAEMADQLAEKGTESDRITMKVMANELRRTGEMQENSGELTLAGLALGLRKLASNASSSDTPEIANRRRLQGILAARIGTDPLQSPSMELGRMSGCWAVTLGKMRCVGLVTMQDFAGGSILANYQREAAELLSG
jgi:hypothetical protein